MDDEAIACSGLFEGDDESVGADDGEIIISASIGGAEVRDEIVGSSTSVVGLVIVMVGVGTSCVDNLVSSAMLTSDSSSRRGSVG